jgi:soluble lytic murein transglycosylase-like protein
LAQFGIAPNDLLDACISTYVAAWQLKKTIAKYGNTWEGVARYHSGTPYFNRRYQILLKNELVRGGVMAGTVQSVAPVNVFSHLNVAAGRSSDTTTGTRSNSSLLVSDQP